MTEDFSNSMPPDGMFLGCYDIHLYCSRESEHHSFHEFPHMFNGRNQRETEQEARASGWKLRPKPLCPKCARERMTP